MLSSYLILVEWLCKAPDIVMHFNLACSKLSICVQLHGHLVTLCLLAPSIMVDEFDIIVGFKIMIRISPKIIIRISPKNGAIREESMCVYCWVAVLRRMNERKTCKTISSCCPGLLQYVAQNHCVASLHGPLFVLGHMWSSGNNAVLLSICCLPSHK
jgi:hypothetical protein